MNFTADIATEVHAAAIEVEAEHAAEESDAEIDNDAASLEIQPAIQAEMREDEIRVAEVLSPDPAPEPQVDAAPGQHNQESNDESKPQ
jgi:hypothetical protein